MSDTAYGDIMEEKRKLMEQDEGWSFFEEKSVMERFKELYKENQRMKEMIDSLFREIDTYKRKQEALLGKNAVKVQGIDFDTKLPKDLAEPKGSIEDGIDLV